MLYKTLPYSKGISWSLEIEAKVVVGGGLGGLCCLVAGGGQSGQSGQSRFDSFFPGRQIPDRKEKQTVVKRCQISTGFTLKSRALAKHNKG